MGSEKKRKRRDSEGGEEKGDRAEKAERKRVKRALKEKRLAEAEADKQEDSKSEIADVPALVSPIATRKLSQFAGSGLLGCSI